MNPILEQLAQRQREKRAGAPLSVVRPIVRPAAETTPANVPPGPAAEPDNVVNANDNSDLDAESDAGTESLRTPGATTPRPKDPEIYTDGRPQISAETGTREQFEATCAHALFVLLQTGTFAGSDGVLRKIRSDMTGTYELQRPRAIKDLMEADWFKWVKAEDQPGGLRMVPAPVPTLAVRTIFTQGEYPEMPVLRGLKTTPFLTDLEGGICSTAGYHPGTGFFLVPREGSAVYVSAKVTRDQATTALKVLLELVVDFPINDASKAAVVATMLSTFARALCGPTPLFAILANVPGAGKSLLASLISYIATGDDYSFPVDYSDNKDEFAKSFAAVLREGPAMVTFDNVDGHFGSATLNMAITSDRFMSRQLGESQMLKISLGGTVLLLTGNNVVFDGETIRRTCRIVLESKHAHPELRTGFRHVDILGWVRENHSRLMTAALSILRGYCQAGRPDQKLTKWGSFQRWSDLVRSSIVWAGGADCYANTAIAQSDPSNTDMMFLVSVVHALRDFDKAGTGKTSGEIAEAASTGRHKALELALETMKLPAGKISANMVSRRLTKLRNRRTEDRYYIDSTTVHNQQVWIVKRDEEGELV